MHRFLFLKHYFTCIFIIYYLLFKNSFGVFSVYSLKIFKKYP